MDQKLYSIVKEIFQLESYVQGWRDKEALPSIEKDLVLRKLQDIYEQVKLLDASFVKTDQKTETVIQETVVYKSPEQEITVPGPVKEIIFENKTGITEETKSVIHEIPLKTEPVNQEENHKTEPQSPVIEITVSSTQVEIEKTKEATREKEVTKEILAEKLSHTHKLVNETIKTRTVMDVSSKLKASPIPSIQSAINLNDKFVFIRELFKNNNLLYNQTIERLNTANNYEDAIAIIRKEFAWDMGDPVVNKLVELIKRKHNA